MSKFVELKLIIFLFLSCSFVGCIHVFKKGEIPKIHHLQSPQFSQLLVLVYQGSRVVRATQSIEEKTVQVIRKAVLAVRVW